jgi:glycogen debranching enzyme
MATCSGAASSTSRRQRQSRATCSDHGYSPVGGVRTLAEGEGRFNPIGYHVGTVWPFDNSFIAWGLRRYGFKQEAAQIAAGILNASALFDGRLPEAFGGYEQEGD